MLGVLTNYNKFYEIKFVKLNRNFEISELSRVKMSRREEKYGEIVQGMEMLFFVDVRFSISKYFEVLQFPQLFLLAFVCIY